MRRVFLLAAPIALAVMLQSPQAHAALLAITSLVFEMPRTDVALLAGQFLFLAALYNLAARSGDVFGPVSLFVCGFFMDLISGGPIGLGAISAWLIFLSLLRFNRGGGAGAGASLSAVGAWVNFAAALIVIAVFFYAAYAWLFFGLVPNAPSSSQRLVDGSFFVALLTAWVFALIGYPILTLLLALYRKLLAVIFGQPVRQSQALV
ncbi:MAG: hypothetical protein AAGG72_04445 [Pseudomonadota bacterium]